MVQEKRGRGRPRKVIVEENMVNSFEAEGTNVPEVESPIVVETPTPEMILHFFMQGAKRRY